jgi:hypothetical protein
VSVSSDDELRDLDDLLWSLLSERDRGERSESELREALIAAYPSLAAQPIPEPAAP